ncbi:MAG TPA: 50S ribosomal protein L1 [Candidatus Saccharimonadales bacterium]|nr:50S ribosomal protein L1 [Candidatus Saccharimonadales bacterium]
MAKKETKQAEKATKVEQTTAPPEEQVIETPKKTAVAKAGKRSSKALKEAEEKTAKEARKTENAPEDQKSAHAVVKPTRSRLDRKGKKFRKVAQQIDKTKTYNLSEALELATKTSPVKFDASVELHINLNVDPRHADQNVRDSLVLPAGTGKQVRVAVFAEAEAPSAKEAGADIAGVENVVKLLDKGQLNFDILIATPAQMPKLGKYARALGPRGLMPNPKSGTVTTDVAKAIHEAKSGRIEYRVDSSGIVHVSIGKVSFGKDKLLDNARALLASIKSNKPASVKSNYLKTAHVATAMGPSIRFEPNE